LKWEEAALAPNINIISAHALLREKAALNISGRLPPPGKEGCA
jgi:hypothetical protein